MYNPKDIFTEDGYQDYLCHLRNIENGLFYIQNHADDLHLFNEDWLDIVGKFEELLPLLKKGDGEKEQL